VARFVGLGPRRPLELIVPVGTADVYVNEFLSSKRRWIGEKVEPAREISERPHRLGAGAGSSPAGRGHPWFHATRDPDESLRGRRA